MPEMDGFEASRQINLLTRLQGQEDFVNIVALTSFTSSDIKAKVLASGMKEMLNKPINRDELDRIIRLYFYRVDKSQLEEGHNELLHNNTLRY